MTDSPDGSQRFDGQIALVTGAAQGLGLGIAETLARRGAHVLLADRQVDKVNSVAANLRDDHLQVDACCLDIADSRSVQDCFDHIVATYGRLDLVVNNAGVGQNVTAIANLTDEEWQRVIQITLTGTFYCCRAAAKVMEKQASGVIVNIASINGINPAPLVAAYNVAKAGVISLTRSLALELAAYGVRVNAVCPGPIYTEFNRTVMAQRGQGMGLDEMQMVERVRSAIPLGRWGEVDDIANAVAFLCSSQAAWMTGEILRVSGGLEGVGTAPPRRPEKE